MMVSIGKPRNFANIIRLYNSALAFTSNLLVALKIFSAHHTTVMVLPHYKIHSKIFHCLGPVHPFDITFPAFMRLIKMFNYAKHTICTYTYLTITTTHCISPCLTLLLVMYIHKIHTCPTLSQHIECL